MPDTGPPIVAVALNASFDRVLQVPDLTPGAHVQGRLVSIQPAGKGVNVARLLGLLGTPCILTGFVGEGDGGRFERSFAGSPVRVEMFEGRGATRENITLIDPARGTETHIRDAGFPLAADDLSRLERQLESLVAPDAYVVFAGSLPPGMEPEAFARLIGLCQDRGARVAVDSSGPGLEAIRQVSPFDFAQGGLGKVEARGLWLIKPNREELAELARLLRGGSPSQGERGGSPHPPRDNAIRSDADLRAVAAPLLEHIDVVAVTLGADGACLFTRKGAWRARLRYAGRKVVKTVGAGDAFLAGFIHSHAAGRPASDCLRYAVACGTASTYQVRAGGGQPRGHTDLSG